MTEDSIIPLSPGFHAEADLTPGNLHNVYTTVPPLGGNKRIHVGYLSKAAVKAWKEAGHGCASAPSPDLSGGGGDVGEYLGETHKGSGSCLRSNPSVSSLSACDPSRSVGERMGSPHYVDAVRQKLIGAFQEACGEDEPRWVGGKFAMSLEAWRRVEEAMNAELETYIGRAIDVVLARVRDRSSEAAETLGSADRQEPGHVVATPKCSPPPPKTEARKVLDGRARGMPVEEARQLLDGIRDPKALADYYRNMARLENIPRQAEVWSQHASNIEAALLTLQSDRGDLE